jgi:alpha-1,6-mannosyltransferase
MRRINFLLILLGLALLLTYAAAYAQTDLRKHTIEFEIAFGAAFILYLIAVALILRPAERPGRSTLALIFGFALLFRLVLLPTRPTLSDDMFRYVWDGRVQAAGFSPYRYAPNARELLNLRNETRDVWRSINRPNAVTIYPPGAELAYAGIWRVVGSSVVGFKIAFVLAELIGALLLMMLLRAFDQPIERVLIYLWSPLLIYEVAHAGHVDALLLPLLIGAFWARATNRPGWLGFLLGAATLIKLFPILLLPALLPLPRPGSIKRLRPALSTLLGLAGISGLAYLIYALQGASPLGFLPQYFTENFNMGLAHGLLQLSKAIGWPQSTLANLVTFGGLTILSLGFVIRPAASAKDALLRCVWIIGWFTLTAQNLFAWYLLWLLPLVALFVQPGKFLGLKFSAMSAWLIFSGLIGLSYIFFVRWKPYPWVQTLEFVPLYLMLIGAGGLWLRERRGMPHWRLKPLLEGVLPAVRGDGRSAHG